MPGRVLLDTTVIIALFNQDQAAIAFLAEAEEVFTSSIAVGELFYGAAKSGRAERNFLKIKDFARAIRFSPLLPGRPKCMAESRLN